jgi:hypothetical protein
MTRVDPNLCAAPRFSASIMAFCDIDAGRPNVTYAAKGHRTAQSDAERHLIACQSMPSFLSL